MEDHLLYLSFGPWVSFSPFVWPFSWSFLIFFGTLILPRPTPFRPLLTTRTCHATYIIKFFSTSKSLNLLLTTPVPKLHSSQNQFINIVTESALKVDCLTGMTVSYNW